VGTGSKSVDNISGFHIPPVTCIWINTEEILMISV
jgi:hypothetical protein